MPCKISTALKDISFSLVLSSLNFTGVGLDLGVIYAAPCSLSFLGLWFGICRSSWEILSLQLLRFLLFFSSPSSIPITHVTPFVIVSECLDILFCLLHLHLRSVCCRVFRLTDGVFSRAECELIKGVLSFVRLLLLFVSCTFLGFLFLGLASYLQCSFVMSAFPTRASSMVVLDITRCQPENDSSGLSLVLKTCRVSSNCVLLLFLLKAGLWLKELEANSFYGEVYLALPCCSHRCQANLSSDALSFIAHVIFRFPPDF